MNALLKEFHDVIDRHGKTDDPVKLIVFRIFNDLRHRNGFAGFWNLIELNTREEILGTWSDIVRRVLERKPITEPAPYAPQTKQLKPLPVVKAENEKKL